MWLRDGMAVCVRVAFVMWLGFCDVLYSEGWVYMLVLVWLEYCFGVDTAWVVVM